MYTCVYIYIYITIAVGTRPTALAVGRQVVPPNDCGPQS